MAYWRASSGSASAADRAGHSLQKHHLTNPAARAADAREVATVLHWHGSRQPAALQGMDPNDAPPAYDGPPHDQPWLVSGGASRDRGRYNAGARLRGASEYATAHLPRPQVPRHLWNDFLGSSRRGGNPSPTKIVKWRGAHFPAGADIWLAAGSYLTPLWLAEVFILLLHVPAWLDIYMYICICFVFARATVDIKPLTPKPEARKPKFRSPKIPSLEA